MSRKNRSKSVHLDDDFMDNQPPRLSRSICQN